MQLTRKYVRLGLTAFMAVWLSGILFLVCCHASDPMTADSCPLMKMGAHCDHSGQNVSESITAEREDNAFDCCGFIPTLLDKSRNVDGSQFVAATPQLAPEVEPFVEVLRLDTPATFHYRSANIASRDTFLKYRSIRV